MIQIDPAFRAELKTKLKAGFVDGLLQRVSVQLGGGVVDEEPDALSEEDTSTFDEQMEEAFPDVPEADLSSEPEAELPLEPESELEQPPEPERDPEPNPTLEEEEPALAEEAVPPAPQPESNVAYYLYAVMPRDMEVSLPPTGLGAEHPVWLMRHRNVQVMMSEVPRAQYGADALRRHLSDSAWLESAVQEHYRIIGAVQTDRGVIPLPFGTVCADHAEVRAFLEAHYYYFSLQLRALDGKQEWDVKLFCDATTFYPIAEEQSPMLVEMRRRMSHQASGMVHLVRKQYERMVHDEIKKLSQQEGYSVHTELAALACETGLKPIDPDHEAVDGAYLALHAAYLIDIKDIPAFHARMAAVQASIQARGLRIQHAGPWLPFSFVRTDFDVANLGQAA